MPMKYNLVQMYSSEELAEAVQEYLDEGWVPQGGISVRYDPENRDGFETIYCQAVVMESSREINQ